jgi:RimJ/RimL family protein N-acetyltransferase
MARIDTRTFRSKDGVPFEVRSPEVAEAQALLEFAVTTAASTDQILTRPEEFPDLEGEKAYIQAALEDDAAFQIAAIHAGRFIGTLGFHGGRNFRNRHTAELGMMVASDWRGRGVGAALIQCALDWARTHPLIEKVCLSVYDGNVPGRALYRKMGFEEEGRLRGHIQLENGRVEDLLHMAVWVKPRR